MSQSKSILLSGISRSEEAKVVQRGRRGKNTDFKYGYSYSIVGDSMGTTTIQVDKSTIAILDKVKKKFAVKSYDKAIRKMASKEIKIPKSLFGVHPEMKPFKRDEDDFHNL